MIEDTNSVWQTQRKITRRSGDFVDLSASYISGFDQLLFLIFGEIAHEFSNIYTASGYKWLNISFHVSDFNFFAWWIP